MAKKQSEFNEETSWNTQDPGYTEDTFTPDTSYVGGGYVGASGNANGQGGYAGGSYVGASYVGADQQVVSAVNRKKGNFRKTLVGSIIAVAVIAALIAFVIWPFMIQPNLADPNLSTPEILQSYCYSTEEEDVILTFTECTEDGQVKATWEFINNGKYGKVNLTGKITQKKNNGDMVIEWTSNTVEIMPDGITWTDEVSAKISKKWTVVKTDTLTLTAGTNDEYTIDSADDFQKLSGSSGTYHLKADIDLSGTSWTPIEGFTGLLLGNGFTIKNLTIESSASNVGFFTTLEGIVQNVKFENVKINVSGSQENVGVLCGTLQGKATNIEIVSGSVDAKSAANVGGIAGNMSASGNSTCENLKNNAAISGADYVGGIFGKVQNKDSYSGYIMQFTGLENSGAINGKSYTGGIFGDAATATVLTASELTNTGNVTGTQYVGGIAGSISGYKYKGVSYIQNASCSANIKGEAYVGCIAGKADLTVNSCSNTGSTLTATKYITDNGVKYAYVGGISGYVYAVSDCTNDVAISYTAGGACVGGIAGYLYAEGSSTFENLKNNAAISGADYVGGIFGKVQNKDSYSGYVMQFTGLENSGTISGSTYVGGIIGNITVGSTVYMVDFVNNAYVSGSSNAGGLVGYAKGYSKSYIKDSSTAYGSMFGKSENITIS